MPPRKGQTRSRTGPSSSIRTGSRVTKPTRSASERTAKSEQAISDSINSSDIHENHIQVPSTPPPPPASTSKEPYTPVSSRTTKTQPGTNSNAQNKGERRGVASPMTPLSPAKTPDLAPSTQTTSAINAQAKAEAKVKYDIDDEALRMPEAQVKRYWRNIEESRITPQVHQEGVSMYEKILRHFDLSSKYGPCIGIARIRRWRRARRLNLNPPVEVLAVLLKLEERGEPRQMAYLDSLLS